MSGAQQEREIHLACTIDSIRREGGGRQERVREGKGRGEREVATQEDQISLPQHRQDSSHGQHASVVPERGWGSRS
jgi:hypothetical protein